MLYTRLTENTGRKNRQKMPSGQHRTTLSSYIFATKASISACICMYLGKHFKTAISPPHVRTIWRTSAHWRLRSVREFGALLQISTGFASWLRYCSGLPHWRPAKLCTIFGRLLGWYTIYTFWELLPLTEFYQLQNSLCVQVLRSPILAALVHSTRAAAVSQILWHGTKNGITELSQRAPPIFGWAAITLGIGPHSSYYHCYCLICIANWLLLVYFLTC